MGSFWLEKETVEQVSLWVTRCSVLLSFGAHLVLALFAGIRRREDSRVQRSPVWLAYQLADLAPKLAIGKLYLDNPSSSNQLFAFWVPFVLLHLGLTDNISAYSLEDNKLPWRQVAEMGLLLFVALIGAYNQRFLSSDRALCSAFVMMFFLGFYKYGERIWALHLAGFARIRSSYKEKVTRRFSPHQVEPAKLEFSLGPVESCKLDYYDALCDAHGMLGISVGAFADYEVKLKENPQENNFTTWYTYRRDVVKVVEMELSLMYDIMYTKAAVIHTWPGYIIRLASPPITLAALLLFIFHSKEGHNHEGIDINITYTLLIGTLLLDVRWLLRALGSTWTYAFLKDTKCKVLKYKALCCQSGWWYVLRRFLLYLDLYCRLRHRKESSGFAKKKDAESSHRLWSRTIGQHNLLHECTGGTPMSKIGWKDKSDCESVGVKSLLELLCKFVWTSKILVISASAVFKPQSYHRGRTDSEPGLFDAEFGELVITWHIATDIFLLGRPDLEQGSDSDRQKIKALSEKIKALSDYMLFLVVKRPEMLPSLKLLRKYKQIRDALQKIVKHRSKSNISTDRVNLAGALREMQQDRIKTLPEVLQDAIKYAKLLEKLCLPPLHDKHSYNKDWETIVSEAGMSVLDTSVSKLLILVTAFQEYAQPPQPGRHVLVGRQSELWALEDFVAVPWIRLLIFGSTRCSRDAHANQLSNGGELTTIIWILAEHARVVKVPENDMQPYELWTRPSM